MKASVSCIILNYNDADTTIRLIDHSQNFDVFDKLIVVDNKSTDDSRERLLPYANDHVHVISSDKNGGYGYGNNVGLKYARDILQSEFCVIANPDVLFENEAVAALLNFIENNDSCAIAACAQKGGARFSAWKETGLWGDLVFNSILLNRLFQPRYYPASFFDQDVCNVYAVSGCFFMARLDALFDIGLYDEEFFLYEEEKCIAHKLKEKGWQTFLLTKYDYVHDHSVSIGKSIKGYGHAKKIVLESNLKYLRKYRAISEAAIKCIKPYYGLCVLESALWDFIRSKTK